MVVDTVKRIIRTDTVLSLLAGKSTVKGLVVGMDVIFMSFENFCFTLFLAAMIIPLIAVGIAEFFIWLKEKVKSMERCCGTCKYHEHENISDGYVCCNSDSEYVADWTDYEDCCEEWEERE